MAPDTAAPDTGPQTGPEAIAALEAAVRALAQPLHRIASRSEPAQIAAEVLRLNDAVRIAAAPYLPSTEPPGAYLHELLRLADDFPGAARV